ncbi:PREDICTED: E3 ubiquitin-protein ligase BOI-like isoform X2 [Tarenaya hassleriana]|uniref:E3 ubiquitin-protein ligase BOI-like isoform X2 n=1 Tax=Tarenaya hassleriana TaxID=28532 RepID=UPI00053C6E84|nr:PREDICTED: E3 ubiquitin-protein ligase BOI-like isoform X2 [Tarenaya hassleriana]
MAVQAQRPSTVFFPNRNGQEGNDCSLQPQKPHFPFTIGGGVGTTKRTVEVSPANEIQAAVAPMNPPPPPVIDTTQMQNSRRRHPPPNVISTGLRLYPGDRHEQLPQQCSNREQLFTSFPAFSGDLAGEIKRQSDELDRFLQSQGEQLRCTLAENRERHYRELLRAAEELVARRLREKETEMEKATRRHAELEARAAQLAADARVWQVRAATREAEAASLQTQLQQATTAEREGRGGGAAELEDTESVYVDPNRVEMTGPICRICRCRSAAVVALPCRHLCLCMECDGAARACPLCLSFKNSSVEVFFS